MEEAWAGYLARADIKQCNAGWPKHRFEEGWNPYLAVDARLPSARPTVDELSMETDDEKEAAIGLYQKWSEAHFHCSLLEKSPEEDLRSGKKQTAAECAREMAAIEQLFAFEKADTATEQEAVQQAAAGKPSASAYWATRLSLARDDARRRVFEPPTDFPLRNTPKLKQLYDFQPPSAAVVPSGIGGGASLTANGSSTLRKPPLKSGKFGSSRKPGSSTRKPGLSTGDDARLNKASATAKRNWMKLAAGIRLTLLQDSLVPATDAGSSLCSAAVPFSRRKPWCSFDYSDVDRLAREQFAKAASCQAPADAAAALLSPFQVVTWRCSEAQRAHYSMRAIFLFVTEHFAALDASGQPAGPKPTGSPLGVAEGQATAQGTEKGAKDKRGASAGAKDKSGNQNPAVPPLGTPGASSEAWRQIWLKAEGTAQEISGLVQVMACAVHSNAVEATSLKVEVVAGRAPPDLDLKGHPLESPAKSYWNVAAWSGKRYILDVWSACARRGGVPAEYYFLTPPALFITQRCPDDKQHQIAVKPVATSAWELSPVAMPAMHAAGVRLFSHLKYAHIAAKTLPLSIQFGIPSDKPPDLIGKLYTGGISQRSSSGDGDAEEREDVTQGHVWQSRQLSIGSVTFAIIPPDSGIFTFELWVRKVRTDDQPTRSSDSITALVSTELNEDLYALGTRYQISCGVQANDSPLFPIQNILPSAAIVSAPGLGKIAAAGGLGSSPSGVVFTVYPSRPDIQGVVVVENRRPDTKKTAPADAPVPAAAAAGHNQLGQSTGAADTGTLSTPESCINTVLPYSPSLGCFTGVIPAVKRGTIDVFVRIRGSFVPAFMNFAVVANLSPKDDLRGGQPLIPVLPRPEVTAVARSIGSCHTSIDPPETEAA
ncbi:hypothetical protein DIPPA_04667 [Diplonema papillatum]|nr:hypothetical protein DIPPA_04667 [Diplonema papillatum]|eukprot:gene7652-11731_t